MQHDAELGVQPTLIQIHLVRVSYFLSSLVLVRFVGAETHAEKLRMYMMTFRTLERLFIWR